MTSDWVNIGLAFIEGFGLIISPCILPILPLILSGSLTGSRKRPFGIILGFILVFVLFTLLSRSFIQFIGVQANTIRLVAYGLLILFGVVMLSTFLTEGFLRLTGRLTRVGANWSVANDQAGGFLSGILFGGLTAIIWTPCAGPILAAVIVQINIQQTNGMAGLTLAAFSVGVGLPMLLIALCGRMMMRYFSFFKSHSHLMRKILGAIIIVTVGYLIWSEGITTAYAETTMPENYLRDGILNPYKAPPLTDVTAWINSSPIDLDQLKGKVILIDFWTYSCINCLRTLPYLKEWYQKYHDKGLVIIGVHAPEFEFEKDLANVKNAVKRDNIPWPVALDNAYGTWRNYNNQYWPAHYLIDKKGYVVYQHFGEGDYDITESNIQKLLHMEGKVKLVSDGIKIGESLTPETYLGYTRAERYTGTPDLAHDVTVAYSFANSIPLNEWSLQGTWNIYPDRAEANVKAALKMHFNAQHVYMVMGSAMGKPVRITISLNGAKHGSLSVKDHTLYHVIDLTKTESGTVEIQALDPGLEVYTFTFG
ncbi:MAG: cytochrome c biogenesis protein DipZ [Gammaproteobacteria bacterium]|nr:cytochrome c biogenesis protein DipZ [Gammaproteobacteria bacterium]